MMRGRRTSKTGQRAVGKSVRTGRRVRRVKRAALIAGAVKVAGSRRRIRRTKRAAAMVGGAKVAKTRATRRRRAAVAVTGAQIRGGKMQRRMSSR